LVRWGLSRFVDLFRRRRDWCGFDGFGWGGFQRGYLPILVESLEVHREGLVRPQGLLGLRLLLATCLFVPAWWCRANLPEEINVKGLIRRQVWEGCPEPFDLRREILG
jgi:hypothetical protein